jgi:hypothetical protein
MVLGSRMLHSLTQLRRRDTHAECIFNGQHQAWIGQRMGVASTSWVKLGALWAPSLTTTRSSRVKKHAPHHA